MDFRFVDKKYRPVPFWSWNERLRTEETRRQIGLMDDVGIGGFFMHARGGLQTEYMGEEWFDNVSASIDEAGKRGMHAWAYDENGWPSGFGGGIVNGKGIKYQQKYLRVKKFTPDLEDPRGPEVIYCFENYCFYYDVNPFYVDTLDGEVIADFINEIYEPYYQKYGTTFDGFFTDEPQISRNGIPWSFILPEEYEKAYGEPIYDHLIELFLEQGDWQQTRMNFWKLVTELFSKNYNKQIYDWCEAHGLLYTGHLVLEETLESQLTSNGACMPHYEYYHIPGMDWLCRPIFPCLTMAQLCSTAAQTGKKQILSETFALCGHNVGHEELKRNYEWMMVRGVNLMCQHLEGYSLRGIRKRDYPPAMYCQQPWWADYKVFNDAMSRIGMMLAEGEIRYDTLVMHPQTSAWISFNCGANQGLGDYHTDVINVMNALDAKHVLYHLGDEIMIERHGKVENGKFVIGQQSYSTVVLTKHIAYLPHTEALLAEFKAQGGRVVTVDEVEAIDLIDNPNVTYTKRYYDGFELYYFVNSTDHAQPTNFKVGSYAIDIETGEKVEFYGTYNFPAYGSIVVIDDGTAHAQAPAPRALADVCLCGDWQVKTMTDNALTLDTCTYWFDGVLQQENACVLNVAQRAYELGRGVDIKCRFTFNAEYIPERIFLACETPEIFDIKLNGKSVDKTDCGFFRDHSFRMLNVAGLVVKGENVLELQVYLKEPDEVYENLKKSRIFESEKNKLTFQTEIEPMYLVGDFGVKAEGKFEPIPNKAFYFEGDFALTEAPKTLTLKEIEKQGLLFFSGEVTLSKTVTLDGSPCCLKFDKKGINAIRVKVNGKDVRTVMWTPFEVDISDYVVAGENEIELTLVNNLRNLMGPHHHAAGELLAVAPPHFFDEGCIWNNYCGGYYTPKYSFVETGLI